MKKFRVVLPIEIDGRVHEYGAELELDLETAVRFAHALIAVEKEGEDGGNQ